MIKNIIYGDIITITIHSYVSFLYFIGITTKNRFGCIPFSGHDSFQ